MSNINIVRGDTKNKPVSSELLATYFESLKTPMEGILYLGYPIIGTTQGGFQIDAILITKEKGVFIFDIVEGPGITKYGEVQDEIYNKLKSKLIQHKGLTNKRNLAFEINTVTYAPSWSNIDDNEYPILN